MRSPESLRNTLELLDTNKKLIEHGEKNFSKVESVLEDATHNFEDLLSENSPYILDDLQCQRDVIQQAHQLTELTLRANPVAIKGPFFYHDLVACHFYQTILAKIIPVLDSSLESKPLLSCLTLLEQLEFYLRAGSIFLEHHCYQDAAWYLGRAKTLSETEELQIQQEIAKQYERDICQKMQDLEIKVRQNCSASLSRKTVLKEQLDNALNQLDEMSRQEGNITNALTELLENCSRWLNNLEEHLYIDEAKKFAQRLKEYLSCFKQPNLAAIINRYRINLIELRNRLNPVFFQVKQEPLNFTKLPCLKYRQKLKELRNEISQGLKNNLPSNTISTNYSDGISALLKQMVGDLILFLGEPPGKSLALIATGSLSRKELVPYSDIDIAILVADEVSRSQPYYLYFTEFLKLELTLLGDPWFFDTLSQQYVSQGIHIDPSSFPTPEAHLISTPTNDFIQTPEALAKWVVKQGLGENNRAYDLHRPTLIFNYGPENLFDDYLKTLAKQLMLPSVASSEELKSTVTEILNYRTIACKDMERHATEFSKALKSLKVFHEIKTISSINLKTQLLNPFNEWCLDIGLWFGINDEKNSQQLVLTVDKVLEELVKLKYVGPKFVNFLRSIHADLLLYRLNLQNGNKTNNDKIINLSSESIQAKKFLSIINLLSMIWQWTFNNRNDLAHYAPLNPLDSLFEEKVKQKDSGEVISGLLFFLSQQKLELDETIDSYRHYYKKLPEKIRPLFLRELANVEEEARSTRILYVLEQYPNRDGSRPSVKRQKEEWQRLMQVLYAKSSSNELPEIEINSITLGKGKLNPKVVKQILDKNKEFKEFKKSDLPGNHNVLAIQVAHQELGVFKLHLKFNPEFPFIEMAIGKLHRRLIGHGACYSELVEFIFNGKSYPVLLSKTIGAPQDDLDLVLQQNPSLVSMAALDAKAYWQLCLVRAVIHEEDGQPANYKVLRILGRKGRLAAALAGTDNDHCWVDPVVEANGNTVVQEKSMPLLLDAAAKLPLDAEAGEEYLAISMRLALQAWLKELKEEQIKYQLIFDDKKQQNYYQELCGKDGFKGCLLKLLFPHGTITELYQLLCAQQEIIYQALQTNELITPLQLQQKLSPLLNSFYGKAHIDIAKPFERFLYLDKGQYIHTADGRLKSGIHTKVALGKIYGTIPRRINKLAEANCSLEQAIAELDQAVILRQEIYKLSTALKENDQEKYRQSFEKLFAGSKPLFEQIRCNYYQRQLFEEIDFAEMSEQQQKLIISAMQLFIGNKNIRFPIIRLVWNNCKELKDNDVQKILKACPQLIYLDLSGCTQLTEKSIRSIADTSKNLEVFLIERLSLKTLGVEKNPIIFSDKLRRLSISRALSLESLNIVARSLIRFEVNSVHYNIVIRFNFNIDVPAFKIDAPNLTTLSLKGVFISSKIWLNLASKFHQLQEFNFDRYDDEFYQEIFFHLNNSVQSLGKERKRLKKLIIQQVFKNRLTVNLNMIAESINTELLEEFIQFPVADLQIIEELEIEKHSLADDNITRLCLLKLIEACPRLRKISFKKNPFDKETNEVLEIKLRPRLLEHLKTQCRLELKSIDLSRKEVNWNHKGIGIDALRMLVEFLQVKPQNQFEIINLENNELSDNEYNLISQLIVSCPKLREIKFGYPCNISYDIQGKITAQLNPRVIAYKLQSFDPNQKKLDWNFQDVQQLKSLIDLLKNKSNVIIQKINLSTLSLADQDSSVLQQLIEVFPQLHTIQLKQNTRQKSFVKQVMKNLNARWLKYYFDTFNSSATEADWESKGITRESLQLLVAFLKERPSNKLEEIDLAENYLTIDDQDVLIELIEACTNLVEITFYFDSIVADKVLTKINFRWIQRQLQDFNLKERNLCWWHKGINGDHLRLLVEFLKDKQPQLQWFDLSHNRLTDTDLDLLLQLVEYCPQLHKIGLTGNHLKKETISQFLAKTKKRWLDYYIATFDLSETKANWKSRGISREILQSLVTYLKENPTNQLKAIDLSDNYLNDDDLDVLMMLIDVCQNLTEIKFSYKEVSSETENKIAVKLSLRRLAHHLKSFSLLQKELILDDVVVDDEILKIIIKFLSKKTDNQLEIISLEQIVLSESGHDLLLQLVEICQNLRAINLGSNSYRKKTAAKLSQRWVNHYLQSFDFLASAINWGARGISTVELKKLINFLINSTNPNLITSIDLSENNLVDADLDLLLELLEICPSLIEINVNGNEFKKDIAQQIQTKLDPCWAAHFLKTFDLLTKKLDWNYKKITGDALGVLIRFLKNQPKNQLEEIGLQGNYLVDEDLPLILELIDLCPSLNNIDFGYSWSGDSSKLSSETKKQIQAKLSYPWIQRYLSNFDFSAKNLKLREKGIGTSALNILIEVLKANPSQQIESIDLDGNCLTDQGLDQLYEILRLCPKLKILRLAYNNLSADAENKILAQCALRELEDLLGRVGLTMTEINLNRENLNKESFEMLLKFFGNNPDNNITCIGFPYYYDNKIKDYKILLLQLIDYCPKLVDILFLNQEIWELNQSEQELLAKVSLRWMRQYLDSFNPEQTQINCKDKFINSEALQILVNFFKKYSDNKVEEADFSNNYFQDSDLSLLLDLVTNCPKLREIDFDGLNHSFGKEMRKLVRVGLSSRWLEHCLKTFDFSKASISWRAKGISAAELKELIKFLTGNVSSSQIVSIDLSENNLFDGDFILLLELIEICPSIIEIHLNDNKFSENIEKQVQAKLSPRWAKRFLKTFDPSTKTLDWNYQNINAAALSILIEFLQNYPENQLEKIGLKGNSLMDEDFILLSQLINFCQKLNEIDFDWDNKNAGVIEKQVKSKLCKFWMERYLMSFDFSQTKIRYEQNIESSALQILVEFFKNHPNQIERIHFSYDHFDSNDSDLLFDLIKACPKLRKMSTNLIDKTAIEYSMFKRALQDKIFAENKNIVLESLLSARQLEANLNRLAPTETKLRITDSCYFFPSEDTFKVVTKFLLKRSHQINYIPIPVVNGLTIHNFEALIHAIKVTPSVTRVKLFDVDSLNKQDLKEDFKRYPERIPEFENKLGIKIEIDELQIKENELLNIIADRLNPILQKNIRNIQQKAYRLLAIARILFNLTTTTYNFAKFNLQIIKYIFSFLNDENLFSSGQVEKIIAYAKDHSTIGKDKSEFIDKISNYKQFSGLQKFWTKNLVNPNSQSMTTDVSVPQQQSMSQENLKSDSSNTP